MASKTSKGKRPRRGAKREDGKRSKLESLVAGIIRKLGFKYEEGFFGYTIKAKYVPDFTKGDRVIEVKGYFPPEQRRKMKAVVSEHDRYRFLMVFGDPTKTLNKRSKTTYGEWCTKNGIEWCSLEQFKREYKKLCR